MVALEENIQRIKIHFHKKMAGLLGVPEELLTRDNTDHICLTFNSETLPDNTRIMLCKEMRNINIAEKTLIGTFSMKPNIHFSFPPWVFVYSSIVQHTILGHVSTPLLKIVPLQLNPENDGKFLEFECLEYFPIAIKNFQTIKFELRDHQGIQLQAEKGEGPRRPLRSDASPRGEKGALVTRGDRGHWVPIRM